MAFDRRISPPEPDPLLRSHVTRDRGSHQVLDWDTVDALRRVGSYESARIAERILRDRERPWWKRLLG